MPTLKNPPSKRSLHDGFETFACEDSSLSLYAHRPFRWYGWHRRGTGADPGPAKRDPLNCRSDFMANCSGVPRGGLEEAFTERTSVFFKATRIYRMPDVKRNALVYLAVSSKLIDGCAGECHQRRARHALGAKKAAVMPSAC
ncbi:MAG TPA: CreA family protein [Methyloceanibacter sp.]|nr:CreA family protein [Methyloceanibacter sp.]